MKKYKSKPQMGRPPLYGGRMRAYNVRLDEATAEQLRVLGEGNLSEGIRRAAATLIAH